MLAIAEFAGNNQVSAATGASPFYTTAGCDPKTSYELDFRVDNPEEARALEVAARMADIHDFLCAHLRYAQAKYIDNADAHRLPAPVFREDDMVFLDMRNMRAIRPMRKLDDRNAGPFRIICAVGPRAYELDLPAEMQLRTPVFHTALLELARMDSLPGQINPPPQLVIVRGHKEWFVEEILDSRWHRGVLQSRDRWCGHAERTWEPWYHVRDLIQLPVFHNRYPRKPGPMPEDAVPPRAAGMDLDTLSLAGAQQLEGGYCHGSGLRFTKSHSEGSSDCP